MAEIEHISNQIMIFAGIIMYLFGIFGNILNIRVFSIWSRSPKHSTKHHRRGRTSNSSLYLLAASCSNLIVIMYPLLTRIMFDGYQFHVFIFCKLRFYMLHTFDLISLICICLATFDRYLISSKKVRLRKLSTRRQRTKLIILILSCLIGIHNIPIIIYFQVSDHGQCVILARSYLYYYLYIIQICFHGICPIVFLSIFGILTFVQLRKIERRNRHRRHSQRGLSSDKQLSRMLLLMSIAIILSSIPYCIEQCFNVMFMYNLTVKTSYFYFFHVLSHALYYTNHVSSFYVYYMSTPNFRIEIRRIFSCRPPVRYVVYNEEKNIVSSQQSTSNNI